MIIMTGMSPTDEHRARRREIFGFMMFDFANSSYTTVIITAVFNAYFVQAVVNQANRGELLWAVTLSLSYFLVMIFGPVFGAMADYTQKKKQFLFATYLLCVVFTALLFFVKPGYVVLAMVFVILSNCGYSASENFVSSFLPEIAGEQEMGKISGYAWGFGYIGGLLSLAICLLILTQYGQGESTIPVRLSTLVTALFFGLAAIPTFLWVRERGVGTTEGSPGGTTGRSPAGTSATAQDISYFRIAFNRLGATLRKVGEFRELVKFLIALFFFYSGIAVIISFAAIYAQKELGFTPGMTVLLVIVVNVTGSIGAFIFGLVVDRIGSKNTVVITLVLWIATVVIAYFIRSRRLFWIVANLAGLAMGSSQSSARALVGLFSPRTKSAEFFGFWGFAGKFSAILGLLSFGIMSFVFSSNRLAMLSTIFYFSLGLIVLLFVNEKKGREAAVGYIDRS
jgi:UMF1 family MFS transporter